MRGPMFAIGCALALVILLLAAIGSQGGGGEGRAAEVAHARHLIDRQKQAIRDIDEAQKLTAWGREEVQECFGLEYEAICVATGEAKEEEGEFRVGQASGELNDVSRALERLPGDVVAEAEGRQF